MATKHVAMYLLVQKGGFEMHNRRAQIELAGKRGIGKKRIEEEAEEPLFRFPPWSKDPRTPPPRTSSSSSLSFPTHQQQLQQQPPLVGSPAPDFKAEAVYDQEFQTISLSQYKVRKKREEEEEEEEF